MWILSIWDIMNAIMLETFTTRKCFLLFLHPATSPSLRISDWLTISIMRLHKAHPIKQVFHFSCRTNIFKFNQTIPQDTFLPWFEPTFCKQKPINDCFIFYRLLLEMKYKLSIHVSTTWQDILSILFLTNQQSIPIQIQITYTYVIAVDVISCISRCHARLL